MPISSSSMLSPLSVKRSRLVVTLIFVLLGSSIGQANNSYGSGCLRAKMGEEWTKIRVCNSDDPPGAADLGVCRKETDFDYMEIRISSENWSSVIFEVWILQILLSEILDVPTTVETGKPDVKLNFYDPNSSFDGFATGNDWGGLAKASEIIDCRLANKSPSEYEPCAHFIPEVWDYSYRDIFKNYVDDEVVEVPQGLGALVQEGWYIPRFTAERDSSLLSYLGLVGEENRHKLAERFLRPTTWREYCDSVSTSNCTSSDDEFAQRPPVDDFENDRMYVEGLYKGYFRATSQNDCVAYPDNCTGHIVDYPCGWTSYIGPQTYHLDIALESNGEEPNSKGYSYLQMNEIWKAANATKSDVMMIWWQPEVLYQEFLDTEAEFMRVALPPPTQECSKSRIATVDRCSADFQKRVGDSRGACEMEAHNLQKVIASGLHDDTSIDDGTHSPGYHTLSRFSITELQINEIFEYWLESGDPREAACQWVVDNREFVNDLIPRTYPRVLQEGQPMGAINIFAIVMASISILLVAWVLWFVYNKRKSAVMVFAQIEFLYMLLFGLLTIAMGAIVVAIPPTDASCVASVWFINLGYTLELVPLIVKVAAINRLMNAARKMRRITIQKRFLGGVVISLLVLTTVMLGLWTGLDPRRKKTEYQRTEEEGENGETIVLAKNFCGSESVVYNYIFVAWTTVLLLGATILAFQMRRIRGDFNESQTLAIMIYSHFLFVILRLIVLFLWDSLDKSNLQTWESLIYSLDVLATVLIYFVPKVMAASQARPMSERRATVSTKSGIVIPCKHCGGTGVLRIDEYSGEQLRELINEQIRLESEDDDLPKWCSAVSEMEKLVPVVSESSVERDNKNEGGESSNDREQLMAIAREHLSEGKGNSDLENEGQPKWCSVVSELENLPEVSESASE